VVKSLTGLVTHLEMQSGQIGISGLPNKHGAIDQQKKKVENPQKEWIQAKELQDHS